MACIRNGLAVASNRMTTDTMTSRYCKVCLVQHDEEIHAATLSVRGWFHDQVTQGLFDYIEDVEIPVEAMPEYQVA